LAAVSALKDSLFSLPSLLAFSNSHFSASNLFSLKESLECVWR
jgi:hypothetical protein